MTVPLRVVQLTAFVRNRALHLGLLKGHADYVRFVVLGRSRSGSNLLRGLLNAHPQVVALGELFQGERRLEWGVPGLPTGARTVDAWRHDPVRFLETAVFGPAPAGVRAVGFKIFYYHARGGAWQPVWDYLVRDRAIHVIHIKRANVLRTYLSRQLAAVTNRWVDASGDGRAAGPIALSFEGCLEEFTRTRAWEQQHDRLFRDHPTLDILYERLAADHGAEMRRVQAFLGLDPRPVRPTTRRQARLPLAVAIANYAELKARFAGSPWEGFFEE
jgi:LPS sulfotransferase NodH